VSFDSTKRHTVRLAVFAGLVGSMSLSAFAADAVDAEAMARESWRESIARTAAPYEGCFEAEYPATGWKNVSCVEAPDKMYLPHGLSRPESVGDGNDFAASVAGLMSSAVGSFPTVTGVTSEKDGSANVYSIQLNSNFMTTAVCSGHSGCQSWEQFVYSSGETSAFMQYWLINYGNKCPSGWNSYSGSCYKNSAAVSVPKQAISTLANLKLSGTAVSGGNDTLVFTTPTKAYSTTGKDSVVDLATGWNESEFNIIGDGGGSAATFNRGASMTVKVAVTNGTTSAPKCAAGAGTTGETNNLTLGKCTATGGATPYIQFTQSD
jgi:hypothetical protein